MKICFCNTGKYWGGMSNCGGSKTIFKSAEVLRSAGHIVAVCARKDTHTWIKHPSVYRKIPEGYDAYIAVSVSAIKPMLKVNGRKFFWMRGLEKWQMKKTDILKWCKKVSVITNSGWQKIWLRKHGVKAKLCYSGIDLNLWGDLNLTRLNCGGLINHFHKTKHSEIVKKYCNVFLKGDMNDQQIKVLYNSCKAWISPTTLEGFHNVPAEANLCGCLIVCNNAFSNGMSDYATADTAMIYNSADEIPDILDNLDYSKVGKMQEVLREKIGSRRKNMKRFVRLIG